MIGPLIRALIQIYGPTVLKTVLTAAQRTLHSNFYIEAGHDPVRDFQNLLNKPNETRQMTVKEAKLILGLDTVTKSEVEKKFNTLYAMNDPTKGGSFYLQCKVIGAKETLIK